MEQIIEEIELLEHRIEIVNIKIKNTTNKKQLEVLNDSKNELVTRHNNKIIELNNINQKIRDIERYGETNPFDFSDIKFDNDEIDLGEYLNIIENNIVKFENDDIIKVLENVTDEYPFILKGELKINDKESSMINAFFSNRDALIERIEKINERYDESVPITFKGIVIKYSKSFNKIRRSYYGTGCDSFKKIVEYRGNLCYIPEENECFRKCLEFIYKKDFTKKYHDFIKNSKTTKNIMTSAKIQPFCKKYNINLGVYNINQQEILPRYVTERRLCLIIHENHFCVIWKTKNTSFTNAIKELEDNFKYEDNQISDNILKQVQEYKFPISNEKDCLYAVFAFDLETANVDYKQYCVPYAAGCYHLNLLKECYNGNLSEDDIKIERENVHIFDYKNKNPLMDMINFIVKNYKGKPKFFKDKDGNYKISCYKYQLIAHNASGFDNVIVLNSLPKTYFPKIIHTSRGILKLSFRVGTIYDNNNKEIPQYMKFVCSKVHISGSLRKIQKDYGIQPQLLKTEMEHSDITLSNYTEKERFWKPYLINDVLGLGMLVAKHANKIQKITGVSFKTSLTQSSLSWSTLGKYMEASGKTFYTPKNKYVRDFIRKTVHGGRVVALNRKFVSSSFNQIVDILEKYLGKDQEISTLFSIYYRQINKVREHYNKKYESRYVDYRRIDTKEQEKYVNEKLASLPISKELNKIDKSDLLVSSDYTSLYPSAMSCHKSTWPKIETSIAINPKQDSNYLCDLFNNNGWKNLNNSGFFKVKYYNPEYLILQHSAVNEEVFNESKNKIERVNRFRNGHITQHLTSVDIEQIVRIGGIILEFIEGFICDNLDYNPFTEYVHDLIDKRNEYKNQGKNILQLMFKDTVNGGYGSCIRQDITENYKCVTENWMLTEYDDRVKNYIPLENGNYMVNIVDHEGVDDNGISKKINSQPFQFGSTILSHSKRLMNDVILTLDGFKNNKIYYGDTDSVYIHKNDYNILDENGLIGQGLWQSKNDYGDNAGIIYGLFLAPKVKYCIVIDENGVFSQKTTFKGFNQNINDITFKGFLDLEKGLTIENRSKLKWKRELAGIKIPHRKPYCELCNENKLCKSCLLKPQMNCFQCEISKSCKDCLNKITRIAIYSVEINKLKRKPENELGYMLPYYQTEDNIVTEKPVKDTIKKCSKCENVINPDNCIKNKTICRQCHNQNMRNRRIRSS